MPYLAKIFLYPIKSLDRLEISQAIVLASGALSGDRQYALFDTNSQFVNGKRHPKIHRLRSSFQAESRQLSLQVQGTSQAHDFNLNRDYQALEDWFSHYFGFPIKLNQNSDLGFPDDTHAPGPTIISTATLETVASWFPSLTAEDVRLRMRANLEIGGVPAFWEDQLFTATNQTLKFQIGSVLLEGINPCQRCIVPTRDALSGNPWPNFQKTFVRQRQATLPEWANLACFSHFYKLSVNTCIPASEVGKALHQGDEVRLLHTP